MKRSFIPFVLFAGLSVSTAAPAAPQRANPVAAWHADPAQVSSLGPEVQVQNYALRLPAGCSELVMPPAMLAQAHTQGFDPHFYSIQRQDGTKLIFAVNVATPPPTVTGTTSLDDALGNAYSAQKRDFKNFMQSKPETGQVGGLTFERVYFKGIGINRLAGRPVHGLAYVTIDGRIIVSIIAVDAEPYSTASLATAEAAALTFHKK